MRAGIREFTVRRERDAGFFTVNGTRESVILRGGIRESITSTLQAPGSPLTRIYEETDLHESSEKPSGHASTLWDRVSIPPTNVFNLMSRMTRHVENIHSLLHLLRRSTLYCVKLRKKLWKCSQRRLKGDNPVGDLLFYKSKVLVSCTRTYHDPALPVFKCYHLYR